MGESSNKPINPRQDQIQGYNNNSSCIQTLALDSYLCATHAHVICSLYPVHRYHYQAVITTMHEGNIPMACNLQEAPITLLRCMSSTLYRYKLADV